MVPIEDVYRQIGRFASEFGAKRVLLFGSRARGENRPTSDIDLAVEGCRDFDGLYDKLQNDLWSLLDIDVINLDGPVSEELRAQIERDGKVLYEKV